MFGYLISEGYLALNEFFLNQITFCIFICFKKSIYQTLVRKIYQRYPKISLIYTQDVPQMSQRYPQYFHRNRNEVKYNLPNDDILALKKHFQTSKGKNIYTKSV